MFILRRPILAAARSSHLRAFVSRAPIFRTLVNRFVAGDTAPAAVAVVGRLSAAGITASIDYLGEDITGADQAHHTAAAYLEFLDEAVLAGQAEGTEISIKLSALGMALPGGRELAAELATKLVARAYQIGSRVTFDMEDHRTVDATLALLATVRRDFPDVGVAVQAMLHRSEDDVKTLAAQGVRVRLVKGAYQEPETVAHQGRASIDLAYVRCLRTLMAGDGYVMVGSHDPRLIAIAERLANDAGRAVTDWEHQMLYGIRADEQHRLAAAGYRVRVYVPYGSDWYGYFMRRLAERPANVLFLLRALAERRRSSTSG